MSSGVTNPMMEEQAGLRKPKTKVEKLCEENIMLEREIEFMLVPGNPGTKENLVYHKTELKRVSQELDELSRQGKEQEINEAMAKAIDQAVARKAEKNAFMTAYAQSNPGSKVMKFGGAETQELFEKQLRLSLEILELVRIVTRQAAKDPVSVQDATWHTIVTKPVRWQPGQLIRKTVRTLARLAVFPRRKRQSCP
jgi:hypothetical protein